jgi:protein O-GlcNAc transferase
VETAKAPDQPFCQPRPKWPLRHVSILVFFRFPPMRSMQTAADHAMQSAAEHHRAGRLAEAETIYREVLTGDPNHFEALHMMGVLAGQVGRHKMALQLIGRAAAIAPGDAAAQCNLGAALLGENRLDEAEIALSEAIRLNPGLAAAHDNLGRRHMAAGRIDLAVACYRRAVALAPQSAALHSCLAWAVSLHPDYDARGILEESRRWEQRHGQPLKQSHRPHANEPLPERPLRIGYVSPDFRKHVVGDNVRPLFRAHNRAEFEIYGYSNVVAPDARTAEFRALADGWREISGVSDEAVAEMIRADGIDILVDLALHMDGNRLPVFARKPAPIQVSYLGYCGPTGLEAMDYRLSDWFLDPKESDTSGYAEKTVRLPRSYWCYEPAGPTPEVPPSPAADAGFVTFGCLNHFGKASPAALELWGEILRAAPEARFLLHAPEGSARQAVLERLVRAGVQADRVEFVSRGDWGQYLQSLARIDVALDPFPYGGGITTCDALWMGAPVVSLSGGTVVGRGGRSVLSNIGLPELLAETPRQYVEIALALARDVARLSEIRAGLRERMESSPLRDAAGFARDVEAAYRKMWRKWCMERASA